MFIGNRKGMIYCLVNFNRNYKHFIFNPKMFVHLSCIYTLRIILYKNVLKKINKLFRCPYVFLFRCTIICLVALSWRLRGQQQQQQQQRAQSVGEKPGERLYAPLATLLSLLGLTTVE